MTPERSEEVVRILRSALERDVADRTAFLDEVCPQDSALRAEVDSLLARIDPEEWSKQSSREAICTLDGLPTRTNTETRTVPPFSEIWQRVGAGKVIAGRFEILSRIGLGGMGAVFKVWDRVLEEEAALKILLNYAASSRSAARRFRSEIKLARKVSHRNVCRIYDYGEADNCRFISMELIEGVDLRRLLLEKAPLPPEVAYNIALQAAEGLQAIHDAGVVHRDLKTSNLMVDSAGQVKLMDFGIAKKSIAAEQNSSHSTTAGQIVGTIDYMSPEQAQGDTVDLRSDIYSFGVVLYELFTGDLPFKSATPLGIIFKHVHEPPPLDGTVARDIPRPMVPVLAKALAKQPHERYRSVRELAQDIVRARHELSTPEDPSKLADFVRSVSRLQAESSADEESYRAIRPETPEVDANTPAQSATVTVRAPRTPKTSWRRRAFLLSTTSAVLAVATAGMWWMSRTMNVTTVSSAVPERAGPSAGVAPLASVRINALPWARVRLVSVDAAQAIPSLTDDERTTPCTMQLAEGQYILELENGGLTLPRRENIDVRAGLANEFVFRMPGFDAKAAAITALGAQ